MLPYLIFKKHYRGWKMRIVCCGKRLTSWSLSPTLWRTDWSRARWTRPRWGRYRYLYIYVTLYIYIYIISILSTLSGGRDDVCDEEGACGGAAARPGHQHQAGGGPAQVDITSRDASTSTLSFVCLLSGSRGWSSSSRAGVRRCSDRRKKW